MTAAPSSACGSGPAPFTVPNSFYLVTTQNATITNNKSGNGDSITSGAPCILTDAGASFDADDVNSRVSIQGSTTPANDTYPPVLANTTKGFITTNPGGTQIGYLNSTGVTEAYSGAWEIPGKFSQLVDITNGKVFSQATPTARPAVYRGLSVGDNLAWQTGQYLDCADGTLASAFTAGDISLSVRIRTWGLACRFFLLTGGTGLIRFGVDASSKPNISWQDGGGTTNLTCATSVPGGNGFTLGMKLIRASRVLRCYFNGVFQDQTAAGTIRSPTGQTTITWGSPSIAGSGVAGALIAYAGAWSDADFLTVHNNIITYPIL